MHGGLLVYFLIAGLENNYLFEKSERPWAHELTSQTGGELMSWSPYVSAALGFTYKRPDIVIENFCGLVMSR